MVENILDSIYTQLGGVKTFTVEEVSKHNSKETGIWTIIDGKVYDITEWVPKHPGGVIPIMRIAGKDGTDLFKNNPFHKGKNTEGIIRFIVDYRVFGSGSTYLTQTFAYVNSVIFNNQFDTVTFSVLVAGLENNVISRPLTDTHSYEMVIYSENSVGYTNATDRIDLHEDLVYTDIKTIIYADIYNNLTIPRLVRPATVPRVIAEVR
jgi:predicted heme/steroid binding protein